MDTYLDTDSVPVVDTDFPTECDTCGDTDTIAVCQYACGDHCSSIGGEVMAGVCPDPKQQCCRLGGTDTLTDTLTDTPTDTGRDTGTEPVDETDSATIIDIPTDTAVDTTCRYTCGDHCLSLGGKVMEGDCPSPEQKCCDLTPGDTEGSTDSLPDSDAAVDTDTSTRKLCDDAKSLQEAGECAGILIGAAISQGGLNNGGYTNVAASEHSYVTAENEMKWNALEPNPNQFSWGAADRIVNWAQQNGKKVKGHCLVWHMQLPGWMSGMQGADQVEDAIRRHIENVMGHFKGRVEAWDVVNEAVLTDNDNGTGNPRMRDSVFYKALGEEYIDLAFQIAKEQDPDVKLYYNDYSIDAKNVKSDFAYEMVKAMVERGVPIDGVGFQMHIGPPNNIASGKEVAENFQRFSDLGLEVLISEMDINLCGNQVSPQEQLTLYHDIVEACVQQPKCTAITFWGINDGGSWLNTWSTAMCNGQNSRSLLFDDQFQRKDTYYQVMDALLGR